jgi:hypothetical protein
MTSRRDTPKRKAALRQLVGPYTERAKRFLWAEAWSTEEVKQFLPCHRHHEAAEQLAQQGPQKIRPLAWLYEKKTGRLMCPYYCEEDIKSDKAIYARRGNNPKVEWRTEPPDTSYFADVCSWMEDHADDILLDRQKASPARKRRRQA